LKSSKAVILEGGKRREDTFIVKHLPAGASTVELKERFARSGDLVRCSLAPSGTVAIVQYVDKHQAQRAFNKLAFSRYRHVPLFLEWAPDDVFTESEAPGVQADAVDETAGGAVGSTTAAGTDAKLGAEAPVEEDDDESTRGCLFVKNLSFATTDEALRAAFSGSKGFRSSVVMRKKSAVGADPSAADQQGGQSMGYGFIEFACPEDAGEALRRRQGVVVDGHALQLQISQRGARNQATKRGLAESKKARGPLKTSRLCVHNVAFEAKRKELHQLFSAYGSVTALRLPKKGDYSGHRGFAFVDFASKAEAAAAYEALQHTHLYGRRLVIEPAEEQATDVASVQAMAQKRQANKLDQSTAKKRRRAGVFEAPGEKTSFNEAMLS